MKRVRPIVIKIGETRVNREGMMQMLQALGVSEPGQARFKSMADTGETVMELAGRMCYQSFEIGLNPNVTKIREDSKEYFANLAKKGDGSVMEHGVLSWAFLYCSRVMTHELVRHRAGVAISQESLRYVRLRDVKLWLPDELTEDQKAQMEHAVEQTEEAYRRLDASIPWDTLPMDAKKRLTSAMRRILPDGLATHVVWSANHRALRWIIEMRTDPAAEVEIRHVFDQVAQICVRDHPMIYGDFVRTELPDGTGCWKPTLRSKV
ncbi:MAG: thymidylate synthase, flavin-dependent [Euryarchaeota archaeon RBG_19FT_COMBO_69_17]|nr:MAG: thymidylate synthase, flavin-dependent [Euryarchaeota archaeon RBG_19FT_COMBO_69_17]